MQVDWELSQQLVSASQGIRAACFLPLSPSESNGIDSLQLVTGNQGGGLCAFNLPSGSLIPIDFQHNHAVTALVSLPSSQGYVTGCKDSLIRVFDKNHQIQATLKGHEKPVTSLTFVTSTSDKHYLVSGSWDGTAKIWDVERQAVLATLDNHENSVCVTGLPAGDANAAQEVLKIATGSAGMALNNQIADHTTRIWKVYLRTGQVELLQAAANDHEGPIRDIATLSSSDMLATCSNDGTVKLRNTETGTPLSTLIFLVQQHPPMLLSLAEILQEGGLAASAEDGHVVIWNLTTSDHSCGSNGEPQVILHPACVWNVLALPNGDVCTCCQDGTLRIFTRSTDRMAPLLEREQFAQTVQEAHQKTSSGPSPEEVAKLPLWENNVQKRGTSEGQVQLFKKGGIAIAAQWSAASQTWIEVGQVMGSSDGGTIEGVQYDHVLPIEVDQSQGGVARLQIGYNNGENPFVAAQRFIDQHVLPQHHLNDIANYIEQRVGKETPTLGGGGGVGNSGGTRAAPVATTGVPMISYQHLPMPGYKSFDLPTSSAAITMEKMKKKISEFGKLSEGQIANVSTLMETLAATNRYHASKIPAYELKIISDMMEILPPNEIFPALDLARLAANHPDAANSANAGFWTQVMSKALKLCEHKNELEGPAAVAVPMLSLRLFANAFRGGAGSRDAAVSLLEAIVQCNAKFRVSTNKNIRLTVATVLYNIAFYLHSNPPARIDVAATLVMEVDAILQARSYETEATTRALVALGTTVLASPEAKAAAKAQFVTSRVEMAASPHGDLAKAVAKEVYNALQ